MDLEGDSSAAIMRNISASGRDLTALIAVVIVAATGCSSGGRPRAIARTSTASTGTTARAPTSSKSTAITSLSTTTQHLTTAARTYRPWASPGRLNPGFKVVGTLSSTSCFSGSIADPNNQDAWRCEGLYDPCFAPRDETNVSELACAVLPYLDDKVELLTLSRPLAKSSNGFKPTGVLPLVMVLSNGAQCSVIQGTATYPSYNYGCSLGPSSYATPPDTTVQPWTVKWIDKGANSAVTASVLTAWI